MRSSSTNSSWNSSITSRIRGSLASGWASRKPFRSCTAQLAEQVAAASQLGVQPLQHAQAELPLALDGDHPGVRQAAAGVGLELDPLLEVDQVQLDLVGAVAQGQVGDQHVQQGGLARARLAGNQHVLRGALAQVEVLELHGPGAAQRHVDARRGCRRSTSLVAGGHDAREGHFDAAGVLHLRAPRCGPAR